MRRFNPNNPHESELLTVDEGAVPRVRLRGGALTGFSKDGCSASRPLVLDEVNIDIREVLEPPRYDSLAEAIVESVDGFEYTTNGGEVIQPFSVVPDPYPQEVEGPKSHHVSHALIQAIQFPSKADKTMAVGTLARLHFNPIQLPAEEDVAAGATDDETQ
ncbi:hypothetical protein [Agromyces laixinhei]|uniref:hypothetical protein n=1 Tax=Agromyces laixinhei TaxID=2585717 RepID=UPI00143D04CD|nr:hypothetical protein [Agromyces laixinhei]